MFYVNVIFEKIISVADSTYKALEYEFEFLCSEKFISEAENSSVTDSKARPAVRLFSSL